MKWLVTILSFCSTASFSQGIVSIGYNTIGIAMHVGADVKTFRFTGGYSLPLISAVKPMIFDFSVGKTLVVNDDISFVPSIGIAYYKRNVVVANELIKMPGTIQPVAGLAIERKVMFGTIYVSANYCKEFYAGVGINAYFGHASKKQSNHSAIPQWFIPNKNEWLSYGLYAASGISNGYHDANTFHGWGNGDFWAADSWKRKYKDFDNGDTRAAYIGSKTFLVWTTDGQHLTSTSETAFLIAGTALNFWNLKNELQQYPKNQRWLVVVVKKILYPMLCRSIAFEATYQTLKK